MDKETEARFAALELKNAALELELAALSLRLAAPKSSAPVIQLKQAAHEARCSVETMRKRAQLDPAWELINNRWTRPA